ncbi:MAG: hypothetical protein ACOC8F_00740 [Planctomycetota bacterium]
MRHATIGALAALLVVAGCDGVNGAGGLGGTSLFGRDMTQSPEGEYTILLKAFAGPNHVHDANYYKEQTLQRTDWKHLQVVHEGGRSQLLWGRYATIEDAQRNLKRAKAFQPRQGGMHVYGRALVIPIPGDDPGPPEWKLAGADGAYTVVVAKFQNLPRQGIHPAVTTRKQDAVDYCRRLREQGVEAYYHHGPGSSLVTVGTFGSDAVVSVPVPGTGEGGEPVRFRKEIRSKAMARILRDRPKLAVNGREEIVRRRNALTGEVEKIITPSYPMKIPEKQVLPHVDPPDRGGDAESR